MVNPTPVPSNVPRTQQVPSSSSPAPSSSVPSTGVGGVRIKPEPNSPFETQPLGQNSGIPNYKNTIAQQRAAHNLAQKFGSTANVQINQLQAQAGIIGPGPQGQHNVQNIQLPRREFDEQKRQQQQRQYQGLQQSQQRPTVNGTQMDGTDDWNAMVAQRRADASTKTFQADLTLRQRVQQMSHDMEGGGLMLPLSEQLNYPHIEKHEPTQPRDETGSDPSLATIQIKMAVPPQFDGPNDSSDDNIKDDPDLEDDVDAINSDLDDPEEDVVDDGEEEAQKGQIMLCTYDKVQRVKNKWKCTLKDGTLTTGGKE